MSKVYARIELERRLAKARGKFDEQHKFFEDYLKQPQFASGDGFHLKNMLKELILATEEKSKIQTAFELHDQFGVDIPNSF